MRLTRHTAIPLLLVTGACVASGTGAQRSDQQTLSTSEPLISTSNTTVTYELGLVGSFPVISPAHGGFLSTTYNGQTTAPGAYTNGADLNLTNPGVSTCAYGGSYGGPYYSEGNASSGWLGALQVANLTAMQFEPDMASAGDQAKTDSWDQMNTGQTFANIINTALGYYDPNYSIGTPTDAFYGYPPVRGQWQRCPPEYTQVYCTSPLADPPQLLEQRERGARLYCAARTANQLNNGTNTTMGSESVAQVSILGQTIQLLVVEPTVQIGGPQRFDNTTVDGAQSFEVPLTFGTRITPVQGLGQLGGFGEIRYPVALTSGETEAITHAKFYSIGHIYYQEDVTVSHADSIKSAWWNNATASHTITLFTAGPLTVTLTPKVTLNVGQPFTPMGCTLSGGVPQGFPLDTQQQTVHRTGFATSDGAGWNPNDQYDDGSWLYDNWGSPAYDFKTSLSGGWLISAPVVGPTAFTRAVQDDDHNFKGSTNVQLSFTLNGGIGVYSSNFSISATIQGIVSGQASQDHILQDAIIAEQDPRINGGQILPVTALTVRPHTSASITFGIPNQEPALSVVLTFSITGIPFVGTISWSQNMLNVPEFTVAQYDSDSPTGRAWPESSNLRIGTWSPIATSGSDAMKQPQVEIQIPSAGTTVASLPETVDACLQDQTQNKAVPPPCGAQPAQGAPPSTYLCAYAQHLSQGTYCGNQSAIATWATAEGLSGYMPAPDTNLEAMYNELCSGTYVENQTTGIVSHLISAWNDNTTSLYKIETDLAAAMADAEPAAPPTGATAVQLQNWASLGIGSQGGTPPLSFGLCDSTAHLLSPSQVLSAVTGSTAPTVSGGQVCQ